MKTIKIFICLFLFAIVTLARQQASSVYKIPFASSNNTVELTIANGSQRMASNLTVKATNLPSWLHMDQAQQTISQIKPQKEQSVQFAFHVDKSAPVEQEQKLLFALSTPNGDMWTKEIAIVVNPPERFKLHQNYPNPFNPSTTIAYALPFASKINLQIYNILGEKVSELVNSDREAGYHEEIWNAENMPSGIYLYQLTYLDVKGIRNFERKKMMVVK